MALSHQSCKKAIEIFKSIAEVKKTSIQKRTEENQYNENIVLGIGKKIDGGWESVFINIKTATVEQLNEWNRRKREIPNSSSMHVVQPGIWRIGFF